MAGMQVLGPSYWPGKWDSYSSSTPEPDDSTEMNNSNIEPSPDPEQADQDRLERLEPRLKQLEKMDEEVHEHEQTHKAIAGPYAGEITYRYVTGPDGKRYAVGGSTPISVPRSRNPEETIRIMNKVRQAALAPGDPSPQDMHMAQVATANEMKAREEIRSKSSQHQQEISDQVLEATGLKEKPEMDIRVLGGGQVEIKHSQPKKESGEILEPAGLPLNAEDTKADTIGEAYRMAARLYRLQPASKVERNLIG